MKTITEEPEDTEVERSERPSEPAWAADLENIKSLLGTDYNAAVAELAELSYQLTNNARPLPEIVSFEDVTEQDMVLPPEILHGCLYQGGKILIAAPSKARKTFILISLCLSIANGIEWLGFGTTRSNVLIVDLELMQPEAYKRVHLIASELGISDYSGVDVWSLRGHLLTLDRLKSKIIAHCKKNNIGFIAIDPYYRLGEGCDENANGEIAKFLAQLEEIAHETGAAIALTHHFAKGNSSAKSSIDRMSGAGTFARDPDALLSLTEQDSSKSEVPIFVAEFTVRSFKPIPSFAMRWEYPIWIRDDRLGTALKGAPGRPKSKGSVDDLLSLLEYGSEIQTTELKKLALDEFGIDKSKFYNLLDELKTVDAVDIRKQGRGIFYSINRSKAVADKTFNLKTDHPTTQAELIG